jgi:SanA protein
MKKRRMTIYLGLLLVLGLVYGSNQLVESFAKGRIYNASEVIPYQHVGLILGCAKKLRNGQRNLFFRYRIEAALELYRSGKMKYIIVSGDNSVKHYDEPSDMKNELVMNGVPEERIFCDYAGFRTLDSIVRAKKIFGVSKLVVISQAFHIKRAIYIGKIRGVDVIGYSALDVNVFNAARTLIRECFARTKMMLDLYILNTQPKFLGSKVRISGAVNMEIH